VWIIIVVALAVSLVFLTSAIYLYEQNAEWAGYLLLGGALLLVMSTYVLFQARSRALHKKIEAPPIMTTIECKKCGTKNTREFQRGDYIFKEGEQCQKCNDKMLITAIYREVKEREKERSVY
jgi:hypothetical protein